MASAVAALGCSIAPPRHHSRATNPSSKHTLWPHRRRLHNGVALQRRRRSSAGSRSRSRVAALSSDERPSSWRQSRPWLLLARSVALFIVTLLSGILALHLRGKAKAYVETKLLPPIASLLGARLGREVDMGGVRSIWPLGISLGPCYIGPHDDEFSCAEAPEVRIRIRPLRSMQRRRLTADVVVSEPAVLVCQKHDWTWLGLPMTSPVVKQEIEGEVDLKTAIRRLAKVTAAAKAAEDRKRAAWSSAKSGYTLPPATFSAGEDRGPTMSGSEDVAASSNLGVLGTLSGARLWVKDHMKVRATHVDRVRQREKILQRSAAKAQFSLDPAALHHRTSVNNTPNVEADSEDGDQLLKLPDSAHSPSNSLAIDLESVLFKDGTFMLLAYGDSQARVMDEVDGHAMFACNYQQVSVQLQGKPRAWKAPHEDHAFLKLTVEVDIPETKWHLKLTAEKLCAPLLERLVEVPLDWYRGSVDGEVRAWMDKGDTFPNFGGTLHVKDLSFQIWDAPSLFKDVNGMIFLHGQRAFLHDATGFFGAIPLSVSGDTDINPDSGEYRLSCQVSGVEVNALMDTLKVPPLPFPVAGAVKAVVYCRGLLDSPILEGSGETLRNRDDFAFTAAPSVASEAIRLNQNRGAVAAYDRVAFSSASASFTFNTDDCMANIYGIRATPVGGGEIRGAGQMWICPEAETEPTAVKIDCSGHVKADDLIQCYAAPHMPDLPLFGLIQGEAKIRGSLLKPLFDIRWIMPDATGPFNGSRGDISICDESISMNSTSPAFDLSSKLLTSFAAVKKPRVESVDLDVRLRGFDAMEIARTGTVLSLDSAQMKISGRVRFQGRVSHTDVGKQNIFGDISIWNMKLNQLLVATHLAGSLGMGESEYTLCTTGRGKDAINFQTSEQTREIRFSLQRGPLEIDFFHSPRSSASLKISGLILDELEASSLRGFVQKVDIKLNLQKRRGQGCLAVRRPRFSGIHGESLDVSARWSGDVVTLEKSVLEQANSRYELQGEYVLPGRDREKVALRAEKGMWQKVMAGHLGNVMASLGRWRLRLEVPRAEIADMLPVARLLCRSSDPAILSRSKELFLQSIERAAFIANTLKQEIEFIKNGSPLLAHNEGVSDSEHLPGLTDLNGQWRGALDASGGGNGDITANFDLHGESWAWGAYNVQNAVATGSYCSANGLHFEKAFVQKDTATLHADGTMLGPSSNLHFALLNFPVHLVPPLMQAIQSSSAEPLSSTRHRAPINGVLHMEGDLRGDSSRPECDVQVRLLDGAVGGVNLRKAEVAASLTASRQFNFNARFEPMTQAGYVHARGSIPLGVQIPNDFEPGNSNLNKWDTPGSDFGQSDSEFIEAGALYVDTTIKDGGMLLVAAVTPDINWLHGNADVRLQVRGSFDQPKMDGMAVFHKVAISSPVLPRPLSNLGGTIAIKNNELVVENVEGRAGKKGRVVAKGRLPLHSYEGSNSSEGIDLRAECLEVRARNSFSGRVDGQLLIMGSFLEPEVTGTVKLSHGEVYLSQEMSSRAATSTIPRALTDLEFVNEDSLKTRLPVVVRLKGLKLQLGPELRMVYPLILNFAVLGELDLYGYADPEQIRPKGVLTFENGDVNLVATQVRLNKDYVNRAKFEPEQGLDPNLDLALVGVHWQLKVQGRAQNWQDSIVLSSARSGEQDALTRSEAAKLFENQLVDSLLEGNGQLAFKKLAAATVETLMPKIETKGEFGQARWKLVYAPQIPNLLSLDPTTDPFKSLANLSFGTEVEVQLGRHLKASVVRQVKESEMATQWTLIYQLNSKLRLVFSSIPSVDNRLLFEYSASSEF